MTRRRVPALLAAAALTLTLSACAAGPDEDATASASPPPATRPTATATADAAAPEPTAPVTCDTLIGDDARSELEAKGWTVKEEPFRVGEVPLDDGIQCVWGDFSTATGNVLIFGWSPVSDGEAAELQTALETQGWTSEDGAEGVYVTEDPQRALSIDADGYGQTYLFGDGWVTFSDTKQGLLLIERPAV